VPKELGVRVVIAIRRLILKMPAVHAAWFRDLGDCLRWRPYAADLRWIRRQFTHPERRVWGALISTVKKGAVRRAALIHFSLEVHWIGQKEGMMGRQRFFHYSRWLSEN
jgi:hypothetical protein